MAQSGPGKHVVTEQEGRREDARDLLKLVTFGDALTWDQHLEECSEMVAQCKGDMVIAGEFADASSK